MMLTVNGGDLQARRSLAAPRSRQASVITPNACLPIFTRQFTATSLSRCLSLCLLAFDLVQRLSDLIDRHLRHGDQAYVVKTLIPRFPQTDCL
jgi:hypothetical protein